MTRGPGLSAFARSVMLAARMSTEKRLRKITIGEPAIHNDVITLVDYDPNWPALFERRDCSEIKRMISFRDRLREDETNCDLYARTKRRLAQRRWQYVQEYADNKSAVVEAILASAAALPARDRSDG